MITMITTTSKSATRPDRFRSVAFWITGIAAAVLLLFLGLVAVMAIRMNVVPANLDTSSSQLSDNGLYRVAYTGSQEPLPINQMHTWTLHVATADGRPVENATITVDGDMPQHGHGLPTRPQVTQYLGNGNYLVEGMKFQMGGWWVMEFDITAEGQTDHVAFNLMLQR